jgi:hypothetical protein
VKTVVDAEYFRIAKSIKLEGILFALEDSAQEGKQTIEHTIENEQKRTAWAKPQGNERRISIRHASVKPRGAP